MFRFVIRDLLWAILAAALVAGWYHDRGVLNAEVDAERRRNDDNVQRLTIRVKTLEYSKVLGSYRPGLKDMPVPGLGDL